jgi:hypothetical protein
MPRYPLPREFDPRKPVEVRLSFRYAGRDYAPGEPFEWRRAGISMRRVRQMYEAGKLQSAGHVDPAPEPVEPLEQMPVVEDDGFEQMTLTDLRMLAELEGAPTRRSKADQIESLREHRNNG